MEVLSNIIKDLNPLVQFGDPITPETVEAGFNYIDNGIEKKNIYYYHPDHLGSSSHITDINGDLSQHTEYMVFGEILFDEHNTSIIQPYLFNGKELDSETGLYYYGARYYDPNTSIFINVDPLVEKTLQSYQYANGGIYWDKNAKSQFTKKAGEIYLGRDLTFTFNSYIDRNLWNGPLGNFPAGDKLTSTINITSNTDADNNLLSVDIKSSYKVNATGNIPYILQGDDYFPGQKNVALNIKELVSGYVTFEQHAKVNRLEAFGLGIMGYDKVNVAQKLTLGLNGNKLSIAGSTDIFPSATLSVNGVQLFKYNQPSFKATHGIEKKLIDYRIPRNKLDDGLIPVYQYNRSRPAPAFYQRYNQ